MTAISDYLEDKLLDASLNNTSYAAGGDPYVKLHIGAPGEAGTSNAAAETTRKQAGFNAASGGSAALTSAISWTSYPAAETVSHISLWDAASGGNCLYVGALSSSVTMAIGDTLTISAITVTLA